jgi:hypothetical protein
MPDEPILRAKLERSTSGLAAAGTTAPSGMNTARCIWHSYGIGDSCKACGDPMPAGQAVFEVDTAARTYRLHIGCYWVWEGELIRR